MEEKTKTKRCYKCKETKDLIAFGKNRNSKDGLAYQCKSCHWINGKSWRARNRVAHALSRHNQRLRDKASGRQWARSQLLKGVRNGVIKKLDCCVCGQPAEAHHDFGYKFPLEVVWLCKTHHGKRHVFIEELVEEAVYQERQRVAGLSGGADNQ